MIAPRPRLILAAGLAGVPLGIVAALAQDAPTTAALIAAAFAAIALLDAVFSRRRLAPVRVSLPDLVRMTKDQEASFDVIIPAAGDAHRLRVGLVAPPEIVLRDEIRDVLLAPGDSPQRFPWHCTAAKRGQYFIDRVYLEISSHLGLWAIRGSQAVQCELRVYPDIQRERRRLAALFLNRGMPGIHARRQVGKGRELDKLRDYMPGDLYEDIYWKTTAKRGKPISKTYQVERTQEVYVVIDASRLSAREIETVSDADNIRRVTYLERFITSAMVLGLVAERQGDHFGVLAFDSQVQRFIRARNGHSHFNTCRDALYALEPRVVNPDFTELLAFIRLYLRRRSLLIFLTNLDDPLIAESFAANMDVIARHHLMFVNLMRPPDVVPIFSGPPVDDVDAVYRRLAGHMQWREFRHIERTLHRRGVTMALLDNETMAPQLVSQYMNVKQRQLL